MTGTFVLVAVLPKEVILASGGMQSRVEFLERFNVFCDQLGAGTAFLGLTEGVLLSEQAHERGYETESWVLDAGMAPHERDWIAQESALTIQAYFKTEKDAHAARSWLNREAKLNPAPKVEFQEDQDWNAQWKASFQGIEVEPNFRVLPPWHEDLKKPVAGVDVVIINPGAGFGTGTHETTQLCLKLIRQLGDLTGKSVLDFGSGSGILGIVAAKQGASVFCVEIDPLANDNAKENARLNGVENNIQWSDTLPENYKADILVANILRPILLQFAPQIIARLKPHCELVLSGLIETDLASVIMAYQTQPFTNVEKFEKGEWRAIHFKR